MLLGGNTLSEPFVSQRLCVVLFALCVIFPVSYTPKNKSRGLFQQNLHSSIRVAFIGTMYSSFRPLEVGVTEPFIIFLADDSLGASI